MFKINIHFLFKKGQVSAFQIYPTGNIENLNSQIRSHFDYNKCILVTTIKNLP